MGHSRLLRYLVFFVAAIATILITGCGATSVSSSAVSATLERQLRSNSTALDFGSVTVGTALTQTCTLTASGNSVTISQVSISGPGFSVSGLTLPTVLSTGQSAAVTITLDPQAVGSVSGTLIITSNAANSPTTVALTALATVPSTPVFSLNPTSVSFGSVVVGSSSSHSVAISNSGNASMTLSQVNVTGSGYSTSGLTLPLTLAAGASTSFILNFSPPATGTDNGSISFLSDASNSPTSLALTGTGAAASIGQLNVSPTSVDFGNVSVGITGTQSISVINSGNASATISQITTAGTAFSLNGVTVPLTLAPGQSSTYTAQFAPITTGSSSGQISFTSNANSPTVPLSGTGTLAQLTASPANINFGSVTVGNSSTQSVSLNNTGNLSVTISQVTVSGTGFSGSGITVPLTLAPGQSATYTTKFAPTATGSASGQISLVSNAASSPAGVSLSGTGLAAPVAQLTPNSTSLSFGSVVIGNNGTQTIAIGNTGNVTVTISQVTTTGTGFTGSGITVPLSLAPGQGANYSVTFAPTSSGSASGQVSFVSDASNSPNLVSLGGTGVAQTIQLTANPASVSFGNIAVGSSGTQSIVVSNSGNTNLTISSITTSGTGFSGSGITVPLTLAPGQSSTYTAKFAPISASSASGQVSFVSNASNSPTVVSLNGTGTAAQLTTNQTSVNLGNVVVGSTAIQSIGVSNTGNANLTISSITTSGTGFSGSGITVPLTLTPGQSASYTAQFAPTSASSASGQISFVSNAANSPTLVSLSGIGVAQTIQLTANPTTVNFGNINLGSSGTQSIVVSNSGNTNLTITSITTSGTGFSGSGITVPLTLTPGQSSTYTAKFAPTSASSASGQVSFISNAPNSPTLVSLSGTGVAVPATLNVTPTSLSFGSVAVGSNGTMSATLTATGGSVTLSSITVSGSEYSASGLSLPTTLAAGQSATLSIVFAPTASGTATGNLGFTSTASNSPTISLSGTGTTTTTPCGQLDDGTSVHIPVNYSTMSLPAKGQSYVDPAYGCTVTRLSDGRNDLGKAVYHEYASMTPINADDTMVALLDYNANWYITDMQGNVLISPSALPWQGGTGWRWSTTVRNVMYGVPNMSASGCTASAVALGKVVISGSSVTCTVLHNFTEYSSISLGGGEGDISDDGDHIAVQATLANGTGEIFVYTISTNTKGSVFNYGTHAFDNAQITHSNRVVINWGNQNNVTCPTPGVPCYNGFELFSQNMSYIRQVFRNGSHSKELVDLSGNEVVAINDSGAWFCPQGQGIAVIDLNTSSGKCVLDNLPWNASIHVGASGNGWIVSEHLDYGASSTASYPLASNWQSLWTHGDNEIFLIRADGSETHRLIHHRSFGAGDYWKVPRPSISRDGKWVIFDSDFGLGNPVTDYADVYLIAVQ